MASEAEARAWNVWADSLHTVSKAVDALVAVASNGRSAGFRIALRAALIEHLAELLRYDIDLQPGDERDDRRTDARS